MIRCPVCGADNNELNLVCSVCRSYLQTKVDALDLFSTMWGIIEAPQQTFKKIVIARHKNYVFFLTALFGISIVYGVFWLRNIGEWFVNLLTLLGSGFLLGVPVGLVLGVAIASVLKILSKILGGGVSLRNMFAITAYASVPIVLSLVFVLPVEVALFGREFFNNNPSPMVLKPVIYTLLLSFNGASILWSLILLAEGTALANGFRRLKFLLIILSVVAMSGICTASAYYL